MIFSTLCKTKQHLFKFNLGAFLCGLAVAGAACLFYAGNFNDGRNAAPVLIAESVNIVIVEKSAEETIPLKNKSEKQSPFPELLFILLAILGIGAMSSCYCTGIDNHTTQNLMMLTVITLALIIFF